MDAAIRVEDLSKRYRIGVARRRADTLPEAILQLVQAPWRNLIRLRRLSRFEDGDDRDDIIWALQHVSFELKAVVMGQVENADT